MQVPLTAIIPLKALHRAKRRLAPVLDDVSRRELVEWMFARVVAACAESAAVDDIVVAAGDRAAEALARGMGLAAVVEPQPSIDAAVARAVHALGPDRDTLVIAADLPRATGADLDELCRAGPATPAVVIAPTWDGGTAALLRRPSSIIPTSFGGRSARAHAERARLAGLVPVVVMLSGLTHDVDTPAALQDLGDLWQPPPRLGTATPEFPDDVRPTTLTVQRPTQEERRMPQGTVKHFDVETGTGTVLLDDQDELPIDAETFAASGLIELRLGQRVRFDIETDGDIRRVRDLNIVSL